MLLKQTDTSTGIGLDNYASYIVNDGEIEAYTPHNGEYVYILHNNSDGYIRSRIMEKGEKVKLRSLA